MRTVDPELWSQSIRKPRSILDSFTCRRRANTVVSPLKTSLCDAFKEFWANNSMSRKCLQMDKWIRYIYVIILVAMLLCVAGVTVITRLSAMETSPITINLLPSLHTLKHIDFPAVALCSYNLISRTALQKYSTYLNMKDGNRTYSVAQIERNLLDFGALIDMRSADVNVPFTRFLREVGGGRNITNLMLKLSPSCMSLLVRCSWRGFIVPCNQLFAVRLTPHGFCCAFNSRYHLEDINTPAKKVNLVGKGSGLGVVMREDKEDFAYIRRPHDGIEVMIWEGSEYPMSAGGPVTSLSARRNGSVFISLKANVHYADGSLRYVSEKWRNCRLPSHGHTSAMRRSRNWCLLECRERAVRALCSCSPHTMLALYSLYGRQPRTLCSLDHLSCINKHRENFLYYKSGSKTSQDYRGTLDCSQCLSDCARTRYTAKLTYCSYQRSDKLFKNLLTNQVAFVNTTYLDVFFATYDQKQYVVETTLRWYDINAKVFCLWFLIAGAVPFTFLELLFHCTVRWRRNYERRREMLAARRRLWTWLDTS